ncbi:hypothetical protein GDO86_014977 [Hymenochirus boettgeri]|uniref:THD domain-containing protein n=1 Tax=Hymenochirus boettgeri TaxID=247094 RepID=A0A8T2JR08_9PIPI|nr:hypothetical protein GDO86_014977 [Hymenochirus boettgeri]
MELHINVPQEENQITDYRARLSPLHDKGLRRLKIIVTFCALGLCFLAALIGYQMVQGFILWQKVKELSKAAKFNVAKPSAHLTGFRKSVSKPFVIEWENHLGLAFMKGGMKYFNGTLEIPTSGYYFVYSQVSFLLTSPSVGEKNKKKTHVLQTVKKITTGYPEPEDIVSGDNSIYENDSYYPIYLGALLYMKAKDRLYVEVNNIQLVDVTKNDKTFFGAFMV